MGGEGERAAVGSDDDRAEEVGAQQMGTGGFQPGFAGGLITKIKLSSLLDFALLPTWVFQKGEMESLQAVQIPLALQVALGSLLKLNLELGVYTGDDYSFTLLAMPMTPPLQPYER